MYGLNTAREQYLDNTITWEAFVRVAIRFMRYLMRERHNLTRDEQDDLISDFYPRIYSIVKNYEERGASFEAYFSGTLQHYCRRYIRKKVSTRKIESGMLTIDGYDDLEVMPLELVAESAPEPLIGNHAKDLKKMQGPGQPDTLRRQILFVFCKNLPVLEPEEINRYSKILGISPTWAQAVLEYAVRIRQERLHKRTLLRERRDTHFAAMLKCQWEMKESFCPREQRRLARRYRFHRRLWLSHVHRLRVQNVHLSHRDLAKLFGISKGSVDSAVHVLTKRIANGTNRG